MTYGGSMSKALPTPNLENRGEWSSSRSGRFTRGTIHANWDIADTTKQRIRNHTTVMKGTVSRFTNWAIPDETKLLKLSYK
jgi:hypothetical protein